jgi:hypothetical protein
LLNNQHSPIHTGAKTARLGKGQLKGRFISHLISHLIRHLIEHVHALSLHSIVNVLLNEPRAASSCLAMACRRDKGALGKGN